MGLRAKPPLLNQISQSFWWELGLGREQGENDSPIVLHVDCGARDQMEVYIPPG